MESFSPRAANARTAQREPAKRVFIQTFGCQMNEYDSAKLLEQLRAEHYVPVDSPEAAELILVNTCAIREKAENKVYSLLGSLTPLKAKNPTLKIGVGGCVAQQRGEEILRRAPGVDLVFGTDNLFEVPELLQAVETGARPVRTEWHTRKVKVANFIPEFGHSERGSGDSAAPPQHPPQTLPAVDDSAPVLADSPVKAHLAITKGCNNYCAFCVVPYTRGTEVSREPDNIAAEAERLATQGVKELTLLGQNVNSYKAQGVDFVGLLRRLNAVPGLERLRYTSPHPKDFSTDLAQAHAELDKLCEHLHLPFQAGSDRILHAMRRWHTVEAYLAKLAMVRQQVPHIALSTDIIVGFPGETEEDFQGTLRVVEAVGFDQIYAFKYSPRSGTPAADYPDQLPEDVKAERLERLFALQNRLGRERNEALVGSRQEVLVEGRHPRDRTAASGRNRGNKSVAVLDCDAAPGALLPVEIVAARQFSLVARALPAGPDSSSASVQR